MYKEIIKDFKENFLIKNPLKRNIDFPYEILDLNKIITFVWPRRSGKTYFMFYILKKLIKQKKINIDDIVFIDFSIFLEKEFSVKKLIENFYELHPNKKPFFVFDEIQELDNFSDIVLYLYNKDYKIFLSWSNSKLLSNELSTKFRWRTYDIKVFPLDFNEFLYFKNIKQKEILTPKEIGIFKNVFIEYLQYWAYPEICLIEDKNIKTNLIKNYFEVVFYKDLIERYWINNEYVLKFLFKKIVLSNTKEFSVTKAFYDLKSQNVKIWIQSLYNYIEYFREIFFISELSDKYQKKWKKYYLYDVWFMSLVLKNNYWQRFENIIYLTLLKKYWDIKYLQNRSWEIDFIVDKEDLAIQVCYDLNMENFLREIEFLSESSYKNKILIYFSKEKEFKFKWVKILSIFEFFKI